MQQTLSQNINTHLQADIIPLSARNDFWTTYFKGIKGWQTFEVVIFTTMSQFCEDYRGGY